ncbi:GntR family transcriptional regulator [Virgibacillus necropolis]|nr:GntR family transcriptional regulator [Virgibacillus necropolis]
MDNFFPSDSEVLSTRNFAYSEIKKQIIKGQLEPDATIIEEKLAKNLQISRTPLREALHRLEWEKFVDRKRNGRLKVASISIEEVKELFSVRRVLECMIVVNAAQNATKVDIQNLENLVEMASLVSSENNIEDILSYGNRFHSYLYDISGHKTAVKILYQLNDRISRYRRLVPIENLKNQKPASNGHKTILINMEKRDLPGVEKAMEDHINHSLEASIKIIKKYKAINKL